MADVHTYRTSLRWSGSTGQGYDSYDRTHQASAPPAEPQLTLASDPAFRGDPSRLNPEQLLVLAASSCQLLSFLTVAAKARVDVIAYEDDAEAAMPEDNPPTRITRIVLRPHITVRGEHPVPKLERLVRIGHDQCYIANSVRSAIEVEPTFTFVEG